MLGLSASIAGLIGMAAMFSGASRAFLTSVIFSLETTQQPHLLLPLLGGCAAAYFISFALMKSTIMTEKIVRRGVNAPESYTPDVLNSFNVKDVLKEEATAFSANDTVTHARNFIDKSAKANSYAVVDEEHQNELIGVINIHEIFSSRWMGDEKLSTIAKGHVITINEEDNLNAAVDKMIKHNVDMLPVVREADKHHLTGILTYRQVLEAFEIRRKETEVKETSIHVLPRDRKAS